MTSAARKLQLFDFEDFCTLVTNGQKADLIDGVIYMASRDNTHANNLNGWLIRLIGDYVELLDLGSIFFSRVACKLDEFNAPEPDLLFISKGKKNQILSGRIQGPPDLAVEIVSPDSVERDYQKKWRQYERFGVKEYWIIDELQKSATFSQRKADGKFHKVKPKGGIYRSKVLKGFWLKVNWLWPETRPLKSTALKEILASIDSP